MSPPHGIKCENCGVLLQGPVCHQCGQRHITARWSTPTLLRQFFHQLTNIENGFLYTVKALFTFPGKLVRDYWRRKTVIYYNPFRYVLIWTAVNLLINFWLGIDDLLQASLQPEILEEEFGKAKIETADQGFDSWLNILILLLIPVNSFMSKWLFKKHGQNYAEHLILNSYILGQQALISSFTLFIFYFFPAFFAGFMVINFLIGLTYNTYVLKKSFQETWGRTLLKAFIIGVTGLLFFFMLVVLFSSIALAIS